MTVIDTLITDRTQADVDRVEELSGKGLEGMTPAELAEYLGGMKGAYNAADLNRVNEAMEYLAGRFRGYGYTGLALRPAPVWTLTNIPTPAQMADYLANVSTLRKILSLLSTTPPVPADMDGLTWQEANDIEQILNDIDHILTNAAAAFRHCNAAVCGMGGLFR